MGPDCQLPIPVLVGLRLVLPMKLALPGQIPVVWEHWCMGTLAEVSKLFLNCVHASKRAMQQLGC